MKQGIASLKKFAKQGGVLNYLGKQKTVNAPIKWKSSAKHPVAFLSYITKEEMDILIKANIYGSLKGKPNKGPFGLPSLQGSGGGSEGAGTGDAPGTGAAEGTAQGPGPNEGGETSLGDAGISSLGQTDTFASDVDPENVMSSTKEAEENEEEQNIISLMEQDKKDRIAERTKDLDPLGKLAFKQSLLNPFSTTKDIATNVITAPVLTGLATAFDYAQRDTREPGDRSYTDYGYSYPFSGGTTGGSNEFLYKKNFGGIVSI